MTAHYCTHTHSRKVELIICILYYGINISKYDKLSKTPCKEHPHSVHNCDEYIVLLSECTILEHWCYTHFSQSVCSLEKRTNLRRTQDGSCRTRGNLGPPAGVLPGVLTPGAPLFNMFISSRRRSLLE